MGGRGEGIEQHARSGQCLRREAQFAVTGRILALQRVQHPTVRVLHGEVHTGGCRQLKADDRFSGERGLVANEQLVKAFQIVTNFFSSSRIIVCRIDEKPTQDENFSKVTK